MRVDVFIGYITFLAREKKHIIGWLKSKCVSLFKLIMEWTYPHVPPLDEEQLRTTGDRRQGKTTLDLVPGPHATPDTTSARVIMSLNLTRHSSSFWTVNMLRSPRK